ncbi:hypothetical protein PROFUN_03708 [Planoprotostelium fungivorum]|uniref:Uncharacterized protein n=1 Tax=Planoprotostelium fungivorum TaxID=1890364 RepID=A0A2P6NDI9_9EUKA|nr:hypothetical protein PROFUN_03708 [Planoprotostelium fungivorum]
MISFLVLDLFEARFRFSLDYKERTYHMFCPAFLLLAKPFLNNQLNRGQLDFAFN